MQDGNIGLQIGLGVVEVRLRNVIRFVRVNVEGKTIAVLKLVGQGVVTSFKVV